jgi:cupin fold WbuC family metalloprotein
MSAAQVQLITDELVEAVVEQARHSPRRRMNHNFHSGNADNPHRFLNVFLEGSYVQPHRHVQAPKAESFIVLRGHMVAIVFDDNGAVVSGHILGVGPYPGRAPAAVESEVVAHGIDLAPGLWHTVAALTSVAVCFEVKPGPWDPTTDKEMAPWAPAEGSADAPEYLRRLLQPL